MAVLLTNVGLWPALPKLVGAAKTEDVPRLVGSVLSFQLLVGAVFGLVAWVSWLLSLPLTRAHPEWVSFAKLHLCLWALPIYVVTNNLRETCGAILAGMNRYASRTSGLVLGAVMNFVLVGVVVVTLKLGLMGLLTSTLVAHGAAALTLFLLIPRSARRLRFDGAAVREAVAFSWPLYFNSCLTFCFQRLD